MRASDLPGVGALADAVHLAHPEHASIAAERLRLFAAGCFVLAGHDAGVRGYLLSHPWREDLPSPALNTLLRTLPPTPDTLHLHDLCLAPTVRGAGHARTILRELVDPVARGSGLGSVSLVAVDGTAAFWRRCGWLKAPHPPAAAPALATYGAGAALMRRAC